MSRLPRGLVVESWLQPTRNLGDDLSESRKQGDHQAEKQLRDRAYSHLAKLVADVREAGRYAFRKEPQRAAACGSAYLRRLKARSRRKAGERTAETTAS